MTATQTDAEILAALGFTDRPNVFIDRPALSTDEPTAFVMLSYPDDPDDGAIYLGVLSFADGVPYLGCLDCQQAINEAEAGMCQPCRETVALDDAAESDAAQADYEGDYL